MDQVVDKSEITMYNLRERRTISYYKNGFTDEDDEKETEASNTKNTENTNEFHSGQNHHHGNKENIDFISPVVITTIPERRGHHITDMLHQCTTCGRGYCRKLELDLHNLTHTCILSKKENLIQRHNLTVLLVRCDACGLAFCRKRDLERHSDHHKMKNKMARMSHTPKRRNENCPDISKRLLDLKQNVDLLRRKQKLWREKKRQTLLECREHLKVA